MIKIGTIILLLTISATAQELNAFDVNDAMVRYAKDEQQVNTYLRLPLCKTKKGLVPEPMLESPPLICATLNRTGPIRSAYSWAREARGDLLDGERTDKQLTKLNEWLMTLEAALAYQDVQTMISLAPPK